MIKLISTGSYNKDLSTMTGSIVGSIILVKVAEWWQSQGRKEFTLFIKPCDNEKYRTGRSWKEIAGLTAEDLKYGMTFVGTRITERNTRATVLMDEKPVFDTTGKLLNANHLILYTRKNGLTFYELNERLAEKAISSFSNGEWINYINLNPIEPDEKEVVRLTPEQASEVSAFSNFIMPPQPEGVDNGE